MTDIETAPKEIGSDPVDDIAQFSGFANANTEAEPVHNQPARRGPGRPPGSKNKPRDPNAPARPRGRPRAYDLRTDIAGALQTINFVFLFVPDPYKDDYLTESEIERLSDAIYHVAENNATVKKYLTAALKGSGVGTWLPLFTVVGSIVKVRMDRHGISLVDLLSGTRSNPQAIDESVEYEYSEPVPA